MAKKGKVTKKMLEALMQCFIQMNGNPAMPCVLNVTSTLIALYRRQLVEMKSNKINEKELIGFYITQKGIDYLKEIDKKKNGDLFKLATAV